MRRIADLMTSSALALVALGIAMPGAVAAQDATTAEAEDESSVILVTARKREESLIEVPLAVTVAGAEQLARDQIYSVNDLQRITPALEISQTSGGETNGGGRLRGVGTGVFNASVSSSVALVIDQTPVGNLNFPLLYDMAQVEVLRGPQGTLFGQGASAGVLNVTTRRPEFDAISVNGSLDFADKGTAGSEVGEMIVNGGFNLPLSETLAVRFATQFKRETGLQHSVTTGRDNQIEDLGIRGRLRFEPSDSLSINIIGEYGQNTSDGQTFFAVALAPNSPSAFAGSTRGAVSTAAYLNATGCNMPVIDERAEFYCESDPSYSELEMMALSAVIDLQLTDALSFTSVSAYRERTFDVLERNFSRILPQAAARTANSRDSANGFTQELRLNYAGNGFDLATGAYYTDFEFRSIPLGTPNGSNLPGQRVGFGVCTAAGLAPAPPNTPCTVSFSQNSTENRTLAGFFDATVDLTDQVALFGGLRFDDYQNTSSSQSFGLTIGARTTFDISDSNLSGRIGVSYMPNPDTNLYASFSRGYKPPASGTDVAGRPFQLAAEEADAFELGLKVGVGGFQLSANAFYTELANFQSQRSEFAGTALVSVPFSVPTLKSKGFELSAFGEIVEGFNINAGYQFNIIEYPANTFGDDAVDTNNDRIFDNNVIPGLPFRLDGTQFLNAPKHKFTVSGDYGIAITDSLEMFVNGNLIWKSDVLLANRADPRYRYPAHAIVNGGFGIRDADAGWTASVFVRNLTKEREPTAYLASTFAGVADGGIRAWPVAGLTARVVGVRMGFDF